MRIKEIKSKYTEEELYKKFPWLEEADIEDAVVSVENGVLVWYDGVWKDGRWYGGVWKDGEWMDGLWNHGEWKDGIWHDGIWKVGTWKDGTWYDGEWKSGIWKTGIWHDGTWHDGEWYDGTWHDGEWYNGEWHDGIWKAGTWHQGYINNELSTTPPQITIKIAQHEKQKSSENHYIRQIKNPTLYSIADKLSRM